MLDQFTLIAGVYSEESKEYILKQLGGMRNNILFIFGNDSTLQGVSQNIKQKIDGDANEK